MCFSNTSVQVSRIEERLSTYASSFEAAQQLGEVEEVLTVHTAAQAELRASECFRTVLARALALGNFLNWGGRLGQAPGFRLKNLPKLQVIPHCALHSHGIQQHHPLACQAAGQHVLP